MLILLSCAGLQAQLGPTSSQSDTTGVQKVHIDKARNVRGQTIDTAEYVFLKGDVQLSQDSIFMYCDSAVVINSEEVEAFGNVIIQKGDSLKIFADSLKYHSDSMRAELGGEVVLVYNEDQMWTPQLDYDLENDLAYYYRGAVLLNDSTQLSSKQGYFWTRTSKARFIDSVVVIGEEVTLLADSLDYNTNTQRADFLGPTLILQDDASIYCEDGYYDVGNSRAEFIRNARYEDGEKEASADTISYDGADSRVHLKGNAHYVENDREITSREILFFEESGLTVIKGDAIFKDSTRYVEAQTIEYDSETEYLKTSGRSLLIEGPQTLEAENLDFDQDTGLGIATGDVVFTDTSANVVLVCDTAEIDRDSEYVKAYGAARPLMKSVVEEDTMYLTADTLEIEVIVDSASYYFIDSVWTEEADTFQLDSTTLYRIDTFRRFQAFMDVRLFKGTLQGLCDSLAFETRDSIFKMLGNPILWSDTTQFTADTITMTLRNEAIDEVDLIQRGMIISEVNGIFYNQIKGRRIKAKMVESELDNLHVTGNAESVYYAQDDAGGFVGVNRLVASQIFFTFEQKQLSGIRLYSRPDGKLTPMGDIDHGTLRLEGFSWQDSNRPKTLEDLF